MTKTKFLILLALVLLMALGLRVYRLDSNPPGLYWEEAALGYDAYSIWQTGSDHHGNKFPLAAFESFGDWKPSLYFYTVAPFAGILGLNAWAVRLPAVIAGLFIAAGVGFLSRLVLLDLDQKTSLKNQRLVILIGTLTAAVTPWSLHFSRAGWEANLAAALILWGVIFGLKFRQKHLFKHLAACAVLLFLSMYAYHSARIVAPLLGLGILLISFSSIKSSIVYFKQRLIQSSLLLAVLICFSLPFILSLSKPEFTQRFAQTSLFADITVIETSNQLKEQAGSSFLARIFYHRYLLFGLRIAENFLSHFNLDFLFISGDANPRHSVQYFGHLFYSQMIWLGLGIYFLIKKRNQLVYFLGWWLLVGILPAAMTKTVPHALRILPVMPLFLTAAAFGIFKGLFLAKTIIHQYIPQQKNVTKLFLSTVFLILLAETGWYWHYFMNIYSVKSQEYWQAEYPDIIQQITHLQSEHPGETIYVNRRLGRPAMFYWFYNQTDPRLVQAAADTVKKDQGEFLEFENLKFVSNMPGGDDRIMFELSNQEISNQKLNQLNSELNQEQN